MAESARHCAGPIPLELPAGMYKLCRCGRSRHGWFCDGAHLGTGWLSRELRLAQASMVMICGCAHSHRYPLCDGSHAKPAGSRSWWKWWA